MFGRPIHGLIDSYLPPVIGKIGNEDMESNTEDLKWINNFKEGLIQSKKENKPMFIDFTGYTCTNCRWMETNVFVDSNVKELFNEFVLVQLFTDGGPNYRDNQKMEIDRFGTAALPFYVVLSPENIELDRFHGMDPNVSKFIGFLENSLSKYNMEGM